MIAIKYALFAAIATAFNLSFQYLSLRVYSDFASLYLAMFVGTLAGLVCKYVLDKKYIFYHQPETKSQDLKKFIAYTATGIITTLIFWGAEIGFDLYFKNEKAKYIGAVIGLSIGYISKYFLDKKYVFVQDAGKALDANEKIVKINNQYALMDYLNVFVIAFLLILFLISIVNSAWLSDDSFISLSQIVNFHQGDGMVANMGERVQAFTHPAWFFVLTILTYLTGEYYYTILFLSMVISMHAVATICHYAYLKKDVGAAVVGMGLLLFSKAFIDYSSSGLENPLSYLLFAIILYQQLIYDVLSERRLLFIYVLMAVLFLNRMDYALILFPLAIYLLIHYKTKNIQAVLFSSLLVMAWFLFSLFYFGHFFPNTFYAKLEAAYPAEQFLTRGVYYFQVQYQQDPISLLIILWGVLAGFFQKGWIRAVSIGLILYLLYFFKSGGDFMQGRFFAVPAFIASFFIVTYLTSTKPNKWRYVFLAIALFWGAQPDSPIFVGEDYKFCIAKEGIVDERGCYYPVYGLNAPNRAWPVIAALGTVQPTQSLVLCGGMGAALLSARGERYFIDNCGLIDPLLSQIPAVGDMGWRIGHQLRKIPENYRDAVTDDDIHLKDVELDALYQDIRLVTRGDLFDPKRLAAIYRINTVDYGFDLNTYKDPQLKLDDASACC